MTIVCKFGGTSCADAMQIRKIETILKENEERKYAVVSAPGKRFPGDTKVTDLLIRLYEKGSASLLSDLQQRFADIIRELHITFALDKEIEIILTNLKRGCTRDYIVSRGEYLNAKIIAAYLGWTFIDAADVLFFDHDGRFLEGISCRFLREKMRACPHAVIPGFYGSDENGNIRTFPRGGSDITGSAAARAIQAAMYENWTDVSGILKADPRLIDDPEKIEVITYRELRELSYMGASVLQEDAIFPVRAANIPIQIRNTNDPEEPGTRITAHHTLSSAHCITGIAGKQGFANIQIEKAMMNSEVGFGAKVLTILARYHIPYEHTPTSIDTMSVLVPLEKLAPCREEVLDEMQRELQPDRLIIEENISLIAVVGEGIAGHKGVAARMFGALADADINIRMIDVGFSEISIIIGVNDADYKKTIQTIYYDLHDLF